MAVDYIAGLKCSDRANESPLDAAIYTAALRKPDNAGGTVGCTRK
jgi:hypothetical protein